jgi:hypothetical protein
MNGRKYLVVMLRGQIAGSPAGRQGQLRTHHDGVEEAAQEQDQRQQHVHHADALVVHAGQPLTPEIGPPLFPRDEAQDRRHAEDDEQRRRHHDRLVKRDRSPGQLAH